MGNFLRNQALLAVLVVILFIVVPDIMKQVFGLYNGLGILPIFIILVIIAALPRKDRQRRH